jgi:valyl-tRNA synthetase
MWKERVTDFNVPTPFAVYWFEERLKQVSEEVDGMMKQFRLSEALKTIYSLIWDDFCSWYLEWVKPGFEQPIDAELYQKTIGFFTELMQLLHPFMPFVSEEIYHLLEPKTDDLCVKQITAKGAPNLAILEKGILLKNVITGLRDIRNKQQLKPKETIELYIQTEQEDIFESINNILQKQINAEKIAFTKENINGSFTTVIGKDKFFVVTQQPINTSHQKSELEKELQHLKGFLISVEKKLSNEKFVQNAKPEVLALENKKKEDAEIKIKVIEESLAGL